MAAWESCLSQASLPGVRFRVPGVGCACLAGAPRPGLHPNTPKKLKLLQSLKISSMNELDYGSNSKCPGTFFPCSNQAFINVQKVAEQENIKDKNKSLRMKKFRREKHDMFQIQ